MAFDINARSAWGGSTCGTVGLREELLIRCTELRLASFSEVKRKKAARWGPMLSSYLLAIRICHVRSEILMTYPEAKGRPNRAVVQGRCNNVPLNGKFFPSSRNLRPPFRLCLEAVFLGQYIAQRIGHFVKRFACFPDFWWLGECSSMSLIYCKQRRYF